MKKVLLLLSLLLATFAIHAQERGYTYVSIVDFAEITEGFSILNTAFRGAGLSSRLEAGGPFTLFAPSDAAFETLGENELATLMDNPGRLTAFLNDYIVPSKLLKQELLAEVQRNGAARVRTVGGSLLEFTVVDDEQIMVNGNTAISFSDIGAEHGTVFVIDTLIDVDGRRPGLAPLPATGGNE